MSTEEVKRRTERVGQEISEVIEVSDGALAVVAKCVRDVNETLAIHAAWTDERFDQVERRLGGLENGQLSLMQGQSALALGQSVLVQKVDRLEVGQTALAKQVDRLEVGQATLVMKVDRLEVGQATLVMKVDQLEVGQTAIVRSLNGLTARVEEVLAFAIRDELDADNGKKK